MITKQFDPTLLYKQLEHLEKEIQIIKWELAQLAPMPIASDILPDLDKDWDALHDAASVWEREWDAEWETVWQDS
ncbi:MAG: hypothetical protein BroJett039_01080 [Chloroflexota bacterium]|nr:MAG: hypothetical protein BroJett039_01080 [Chloroflexota bacterium]